ncbi:hypothetical protein TTHERM_00077150 (macronuclear) [Tetrahymena thermophila SB210]|uniref:Uncharacterized protein n=1 Tax=Tetrahymena thermophila (strain SB210) TaxID=312017 RepID=Q23G49_TETTS|nr:hypothetical protein TTHERM_00077150 [Tetrahymena thermophila SB210]EAR95411.2 hypothetical protein TTHERM_00077150 [Tetrahymena thermophila SB210]|eukprot:XP_001015656.2 hypothetical protein TTHERM_00077150 [Tetrahymena thermophila SB210]
MIKLNRKASQGHVKTISANSKEDYLKERNIFFKGNCPQIQIDISNSNKFLSQQFTVHSTASASVSGNTTTIEQSSNSSPTSKNGKNSHKTHRSIEITLVDVPQSLKDKQQSSGLNQISNRQSASISTTSQQNNTQTPNSFLEIKSMLSNTSKINSNINMPNQNKENCMPSPNSCDKNQQFNSIIGNNALNTLSSIQGSQLNNNNTSISANSNSNYQINNNNTSATNNQSGNSVFSFNGNSSAVGTFQNNTSNNSNNTSNFINLASTTTNSSNQHLNMLKVNCSTSPSSRVISTSLLQAPQSYNSNNTQKAQKQSSNQLSNFQYKQNCSVTQQQKTQILCYDDENQPDWQNRMHGFQQQQQQQQQQQLKNSIQNINSTNNFQQNQLGGASGEIKQIKKKQLESFKPTSKERAITSPIGNSKLFQNVNNLGIQSFNLLPSNSASNNTSLIVNVAQQSSQINNNINTNSNVLFTDSKSQQKSNNQLQSQTQSPLVNQQQKQSLLNQIQQQNQQQNNYQQNTVQTQPSESKQGQTQLNQFIQGHKNISQLIQQQIENDLKTTQQQKQNQQQSVQKKKESSYIYSPNKEKTLKTDKSQKSITLVVGKVDSKIRASEIEEQKVNKKGQENAASTQQEELFRIKQENEKLIKELQIYKVDRELYDKQKEYMSKEREFFQNEKDLLNKQIEELQNQLKSKENNDFSSQKTKEAESQFLKERIFQYEKRNKDLENEYNMNSKIYKETITKNQEVFQKYEELKNELDQLNQNYKIQSTQLTSNQIELERLRLKSITMEQEEEDLKQNLKNMNDKLLQSQQEVIELRKKNKDLQIEIDLQIPQTTTIQKLESEVELWKIKHQTLERVLNEERMRSSFSYQNSEQTRQSVAGLEIGYLRQNLSEKEKTIMELRIENEKIVQQVKNLEIEIQQKQNIIDSQAQQFQQNMEHQQHFEFEHQKKKILQLQEEADQQFNQYIQTRKELEMKNKELEQLKNHLAQQKESSDQNELQSYKKLLEDCRNELGDVYQLMNSRKRDADLAQKQLAEQKEIMDELKNKSRAQETELLCLRETYDNVVRELEKTIKQYEQYKKVYEMQSVELHHKNREILELLQEVEVLKIKYEDLLQQQQPASENTKHSRVITKMTFSRAEEEFNADLF